jgi:hypothetical protein
MKSYIKQRQRDGRAGGASSGADYATDQRVITAHRMSARQALEELPTVSLVVDPSDMFDPQYGIDMHPDQEDVAWEGPASLEIIGHEPAEDIAPRRDPAGELSVRA